MREASRSIGGTGRDASPAGTIRRPGPRSAVAYPGSMSVLSSSAIGAPAPARPSMRQPSQEAASASGSVVRHAVTASDTAWRPSRPGSIAIGRTVTIIAPGPASRAAGSRPVDVRPRRGVRSAAACCRMGAGRRIMPGRPPPSSSASTVRSAGGAAEPEGPAMIRLSTKSTPSTAASSLPRSRTVPASAAGSPSPRLLSVNGCTRSAPFACVSISVKFSSSWR
ncbi:hypothetical protein JCM9534A_18510 [Catenuloplanes indicus JCM 9534]